MRRSTVKWIVAIVCAVALAGASFVWYARPGPRNGDVVAVINDTTITQDDFHDHLEDEFGRQALQSLIMQAMVIDAAERADAAPDEEDVDQEIEGLVAQFGEAGLQQMLEQQGMTMGSLRTNLMINMALDELRRQRVDYTEEDLIEYYEENQELFERPEQVRASHILLGSEEKALEVLGELDEGESFADLAKRYSIDTASAEEGGDLGAFGRGMMSPEFEDVAFTLDLDEVSEPVETEHGFHIIKVTEMHDQEMPEFEDVREDVIRHYQDEHGPDAQEILNEIREEAQIEIRWERYQDLQF